MTKDAVRGSDAPQACQREKSLEEGYKEMSRINLELAEEGLASDNDALQLCEQKLAECE